MKASAFVFAAAAPTRAFLSARPWLCGRPLVARLPLHGRAYLSICMCTDAPAEHSPKENSSQESAEQSSEEVAHVKESVVENGSTHGEEAQQETVAEARQEPVANAALEPMEKAQSEPDIEKGDVKTVDDAEDVHEGESQQPATNVERRDDYGANRKRRRRTRVKREITLPLEEMTVGMELEGTVKTVMDYGAFVGDMGTPTDGLLHVSQLTTGYVENVSDVVQVGNRLNVRVLAIDLEKRNFSLTMKPVEEAGASRSEGRFGGAVNRKEELNKKWDEFSFDPQVFVDARVTSITDFGAFCRLLDENGELLESAPTEGLVHISEVSEGRIDNINNILSINQDVKVRIISTDRKRNRISLSLREYKEESRGTEKFTGEMSKGVLAKEIASSNDDQPEFKTVMELAFEKAKANAAAKEAAAGAKE